MSEQEALSAVLAREEAARQLHNHHSREYYRRHAGNTEFRERRKISDKKAYRKNPNRKLLKTKAYYQENKIILNEKRREKYRIEKEALTWHERNRNVHNAKQRERYHLKKMENREKKNAQERARYHLNQENKETSSLYGVLKKNETVA